MVSAPIRIASLILFSGISLAQATIPILPTQESLIGAAVEPPCDEKETARLVAQGQRIAPEVIFHYGRKSILEKNAQARTVPQAAWDQFIRGRASTIKQAPFRQGLYGCVNALECEHYAHQHDPWVIGIRIRAECREPARVLSLIGLRHDPRLANVSPTLSDRILACYTEPGWNYAEQVRAIDGGRHARTDCEDAIEELMNQLQIAVVHDGISTRSWYVRERECIETIYGTPVELVALIDRLPREQKYLCPYEIRNQDTDAIILQYPGDSKTREIQARARAATH